MEELEEMKNNKEVVKDEETGEIEDDFWWINSSTPYLIEFRLN